MRQTTDREYKTREIIVYGETRRFDRRINILYLFCIFSEQNSRINIKKVDRF